MISAIGSDVATWHPRPRSYDMHGRTHGSELVSLSRHRKEWMGRPQGRPYAAKERLRRWVMEKIGAPGFAAPATPQGFKGHSRTPAHVTEAPLERRTSRPRGPPLGRAGRPGCCSDRPRGP